jgi:hypothetical protein
MNQLSNYFIELFLCSKVYRYYTDQEIQATGNNRPFRRVCVTCPRVLSAGDIHELRIAECWAHVCNLITLHSQPAVTSHLLMR